MTPRHRTLAALLGAGLVAALAWALLPRASAPEREVETGDGPRGTAPPPPAEASRSGGLRGREAGPSSPAGEEPAGAPAPTKARTVTGRVVDPAGAPVADCVVSAPWHVGVAPVRTDATGGFSVTLPPAPEGTPTEVRFSAPGYGVVDRTLGEGDPSAIGPVRLGEGPEIAGRVVGPEGTGVAGFTVVLENGMGFGLRSVVFDRTHDYLVGHDDPRDDDTGTLAGFAVTDREGAFRVRGLSFSSREYGHGEGWMLEGAQGVVEGNGNVLRAVRAAVTSVRLEPPTGARLPGSFGLRLQAPGHGGEGTTVHGSATTVWWSRGEGYPAELHADLSVQVEGFEPMRREVVVPAEETRRDVEFRLRPLTDAVVVFTVTTPDGAFAKRPFDLEAYDPERRDAQVTRVPAETLPDGRIRAKAPPGRWWLRLRPADGWCNPVFWEGEQTLAAGRENPVVWTVPPHGGAVLRLPGRRPDDAREMDGLVTVHAAGAEGAAFPLELLGKMGEAADRLTVQALPVGPCRVEVHVLDKDGEQRSTTTFTVRAGEVADVLLEAPAAK